MSSSNSLSPSDDSSVYSSDDTDDELFRNMAENDDVRAKSAVGIGGNSRKVVTIGKVNARVIKGVIAEEQTDIIVNSANKDLDLSKGRASKALLEAAGNSVQSECNSKYRNGIEYGEIAVTNPGDLDCHKLFHGALPKWEGQRQEKVLKKLLMNCFDEGHKRKMTSMAIPAFGTGFLSYPVDRVAKITFECIEDFDEENSSTSLTDIKIIVFTKDHTTFKAFVNEARHRSEEHRPKRYKSAPPSRQPLVNKTSATAHIGSIQVKVIVGSMAEQQVDVIVDSTAPTLKLDSRPGLSKSLLEAAGQSLQDCCDRNYPNGIEPGEVAITDSYKLKCHKVYHGTLPGWYSKRTGSLLPEKVMYNFVYKCLEEAEKKKFTSIAFPALGTGFLKYPTDTAVTKMIQGIDNFQQKHSSSNIKDVRIVIYSGAQDWTKIEKEFVDQLQGHKPAVKTKIPQAPSSKIPPRGSKAFLEYKYREELHTPPNWTEFHSGRSIKDWNTKYKGAPFKLIDVDQKTKNDVVAIFKSTWGGNSTAATPFGLLGLAPQPSGTGNVVRVQRVESIYLYEKYQQECQRLFRKAVVEGEITPIDKAKGSSGPVQTTKQLDKSMTKHLYPEINEHYFFHGTKFNRVDVIVSQGLDCRLAQSGRVGAGVYGAERSSKSKTYVDQNSNGESKMFLIRMCLGDVYTCTSQVSYKRPPCKKCGNQVCFSHVECYDSVVADGGQFSDREFVVYDRNQSYPEYLITYK